MAEAAEKQDGIWETVKTVVSALLIAGVFRTLFFQPFFIPSGSMKDTLLIGDFLFVNKMAYGYSAHSCPFSLCPISDRLFGSTPERGDVVVFRHPTRNEDYIKRLIGMPGDTVEVRAGVVYLNGIEQVQVPQDDFVEPFRSEYGFMGCINDDVRATGNCSKEKFDEMLEGHGPHSVLNAVDGGRADDMAAKTVPEGHFFFMGDNRDNSIDSRFDQVQGGVGMVPFANLLGRADRVMFSSAGARMVYFWTWRPDRFFKAIE